jgi:hypothetical protein
MWHEFILPLPAKSVGDYSVLLSQVALCFEHALPFDVYCVTSSTTSKRYAFALPFRSRWPEDFSILVTEQEWYLNFHVAAGLQQDIVLNVLAQCLHAAGIPGTLEEV